MIPGPRLLVQSSISRPSLRSDSQVFSGRQIRFLDQHGAVLRTCFLYSPLEAQILIKNNRKQDGLLCETMHRCAE
jgi:hypothetical protein